MTRQRSFTTAAARRRSDPIVWTIDGTDLRLLPFIDVALFGSLADAVSAQPSEPGWPGIIAKRDGIVALMRECFHEDDRETWDRLVPEVEPALLGELSQEMLMEFAGAPDPTPPSSSVSGSSATGASSTGGALPEASTPQPSPLTEDSTSTSTPSESTPTTTDEQPSTAP